MMLISIAIRRERNSLSQRCSRTNRSHRSSSEALSPSSDSLLPIVSFPFVPPTSPFLARFDSCTELED